MINWTIKVLRPTLQTGMYFQVRYRKEGVVDWTPLSPNPTTNEFTIIGLEERTNYEAEIKTICINGELSAPTYVQLKDGVTVTTPTVPFNPSTPNQQSVEIYWVNPLTMQLEGNGDISGTNTEIMVGSNSIVLFEVKDPIATAWTSLGTSNRYKVPLTATGITEIRGSVEVGGQRYYSNILKYNKTDAGIIEPPKTSFIGGYSIRRYDMNAPIGTKTYYGISDFNEDNIPYTGTPQNPEQKSIKIEASGLYKVSISINSYMNSRIIGFSNVRKGLVQVYLSKNEEVLGYEFRNLANKLIEFDHHQKSSYNKKENFNMYFEKGDEISFFCSNADYEYSSWSLKSDISIVKI